MPRNRCSTGKPASSNGAVRTVPPAAAEPAAAPAMRIELLGTPAAYWNDVPLSLPTGRSLQLLCLVALSERPLTRPRLAQLLWVVPRAVNLRQELAKLRKLPGAGHWLQEGGGRVALDAQTDVGEFLAATRRDDHALALRVWRRDRKSYKRRDHLLFGLDPPQPPAPLLELLEEERAHLIALYARALQCRAFELEQQDDFDTALRLNRELIDLDEMNESAHRSVMQIEWRRGNLARALRQYEECRHALAAVAHMPPLTETQEMATQIREAMAARRWRRHDVLPAAATPFVGRQPELRTVIELLSRPECRIVSLLGPGGVGKTRLALEVARRRAEAFAHGVGYLRLEAVQDASHVPCALAHAMNVEAPHWERGAQHVAELFRTRSMLLVVDGLERLPSVVGYLAWLSCLSPGSKMLVTTGHRMYLPGEQVYQVGGMNLPATPSEPYAERRDAVRLFVQAARRVQPSFKLTEETMPHLTRIVRLVGGFPLAIEAIACWVRVLPLPALADELETDGDLLRGQEMGGGERHACMHTVFERSMRRLPPRQAQVLAALAALEGAFDHEDASIEAGATLVDLWLLLDHCFLTFDGAYYRVVECVRSMVQSRQARVIGSGDAC